MNQLTKIAAVTVVLLLFATPAIAAEDDAGNQKLGPNGFSIFLGEMFNTGVVILGAAYGISKIGSSAFESMARQPEVAGNIQTAMIIAAALIEGVTFFALVVCMMAV